MALKVLQINLGRGKSATALMIAKMNRLKIDLVLIQEPYHGFKGAIEYESYFVGESAKAVTMVRKGVGSVWMRREWSNESIVVIELEREEGENVLLINVYGPPPDARNSRSEFRELSVRLEGRSERMLLAGDLNGKNVAWGGRISDDRGSEIYEWMVMNGWNIENSPDDPPSFVSTRGVSWVDLVASKGVNVRERCVEIEEETLSDHCYVLYELVIGKIKRMNARWRYELRGVDWEKLVRALREAWNDTNGIRQHMNVEERAENFQGVVQRACRSEMRKRNRRVRVQKEWWNNRLTHERREVRRLRKRFQEANEYERDTLRTRYLEKRNEYKKEIKEAKLRVMEEELGQMGDNVWDVCKRWVKGGTRDVRMNMRREDGTYTESVEETEEELVKKSFPKDRESDDLEMYRVMRNEWNEERVDGVTEDYAVTLHELE